MTWTYDATQLGASQLMQVRLLVGDIISTDQQMSDEAILFFLTQNGNSYGAAALALRAFAAEVSRKVDLVHGMGPMQDKYSQQAQAYLQMALQYEAKATIGAAPYAGGISIQDKMRQEQDPDRVTPSFNIGMEDNLIPVGPVGNETSTGQQPSGVNAVVGIP